MNGPFSIGAILGTIAGLLLTAGLISGHLLPAPANCTNRLSTGETLYAVHNEDGKLCGYTQADLAASGAGIVLVTGAVGGFLGKKYINEDIG